MFNKTVRLGLMAAMVAAISMTGCKKDKDIPEVDEEELITTFKLKFVNKANANDTKTFTWKDIDGNGGTAPVIDDIVLAPNAQYTMTVDAVLNESVSPAEDIKTEITAEATDHLFVYKPSTGLNLTIAITDKDAKQLAIGLAANATTAAASTGKLQVLLRHQPGVKNGTEAPGSSDIDATFNVKIQ